MDRDSNKKTALKRSLLSQMTESSPTNDGAITPTIVNNTAAFNPDGIQAGARASGTLDYSDTGRSANQDDDLPGALEPGPHSIQADPRFVEPAGDDVHLGAGSPCIDAGTDCRDHV
jgi:hypothetical protein